MSMLDGSVAHAGIPILSFLTVVGRSGRRRRRERSAGGPPSQGSERAESTLASVEELGGLLGGEGPVQPGAQGFEVRAGFDPLARVWIYGHPAPVQDAEDV